MVKIAASILMACGLAVVTAAMIAWLFVFQTVANDTRAYRALRDSLATAQMVDEETYYHGIQPAIRYGPPPGFTYLATRKRFWMGDTLVCYWDAESTLHILRMGKR